MGWEDKTEQGQRSGKKERIKDGGSALGQDSEGIVDTFHGFKRGRSVEV